MHNSAEEKNLGLYYTSEQQAYLEGRSIIDLQRDILNKDNELDFEDIAPAWPKEDVSLSTNQILACGYGRGLHVLRTVVVKIEGLGRRGRSGDQWEHLHNP